MGDSLMAVVAGSGIMSGSDVCAHRGLSNLAEVPAVRRIAVSYAPDYSGGHKDAFRFLGFVSEADKHIPMIVQGQIHGGLTQGLPPALYEEIQYDEDGNNLAGSFMD